MKLAQMTVGTEYHVQDNEEGSNFSGKLVKVDSYLSLRDKRIYVGTFQITRRSDALDLNLGSEIELDQTDIDGGLVTVQ